MAIVNLIKGMVGPTTCRAAKPDKTLCGAETFVTVNQRIDTSKKDSIMMLGCYACADRNKRPLEYRPGLGRSYCECKYPVKDHKDEIIAQAQELDAEWQDWDTSEPPKVTSEDIAAMDWGDEEDEPAPPKDDTLDELGWD